MAVIPEIGLVPWNESCSEVAKTDIRTWPSPVPHDEGISLLTSTINELIPSGGKSIVILFSNLKLRSSKSWN